MTWTQFHDMHSGGGRKEKYAHIWVEAPEAEAKVIFYNRFGHNPDRVSCTCCGNDYSIDEAETLEQATAYERNLPWATPAPEPGKRFATGGRYIEAGEDLPDGWEIPHPSLYRQPPISLDDFLARGTTEGFGSEPFLIIRADEIKTEERTGDVPEQGYVWAD